MTTEQAADSPMDPYIRSSSTPLKVTSRKGKIALSGLSLLLLAAGTIVATNISGYIAGRYDTMQNLGILMTEDTCRRVAEEFDASAWYNKVFQYGSKAGCDAFLEKSGNVAYK